MDLATALRSCHQTSLEDALEAVPCCAMVEDLGHVLQTQYGHTLAGGYQVGLRLFQGGVVAGGQGKVGVRVVRDGLVVSLNGPDEHGEVLLVHASLPSALCRSP